MSNFRQELQDLEKGGGSMEIIKLLAGGILIILFMFAILAPEINASLSKRQGCHVENKGGLIGWDSSYEISNCPADSKE